MNLIIIDSGSGNIGSVQNALNHLEIKSKISNEKKDIINASHLILPGVGSYINFMKNLKSLKLIDILKENVMIKKKPFLGICVGMQVLSTFGLENERYSGLNLIKGEVRIIPTTYKLPHIGWNAINIIKDDKILTEITNQSYFYFVHSYYFFLENDKYVLSKTSYGSDLPSIIKKENIYGVQFHPEKSQKIGLKFLKNFSQIN